MSHTKKQPAPAGEKEPTPDVLPGGKIPEVKVIDRRFWAREAEAAADDGSIPDLDLKPTYVQELEQRMALMEEKFREKSAWFEEESRRIQDRLGREMERRLEEEKGRLALDLLEVLDNLEKAIETSRQGAAADQVLQGVSLVRDGFRRKMERLGLQPLGGEGESFDPRWHEAVEMRPVSDPAQDGMIVAVWQKGYAAGERLVRPARVSVGRYEADRGDRASGQGGE